MAVVPALRQRGVRVIDLSADYRLTDAQVYADWYGHAHTDPEGLRSAVYGLPELFRERIPPADLIANPGCYTSTSILAPGALDRRGPDRAHRDHHRRQERGLGRGPVAQADVPLPRMQREPLGLQRRPAPAHARDRPGADRGRRRPRRAGRGDLHAAPGADGPRHLRHDLRPAQGRTGTEHDLLGSYRRILRRSPFVRVVGHLPATKDSAFTNFCDITVRVVRGRILVLACLDNLIKGAAGVAVQNLNLMLGCAEETALLLTR